MIFEYVVQGERITLEQDLDKIGVRFAEGTPRSVQSETVKDAGLGPFESRIEVPNQPYIVMPVAESRESRPERFEKARSSTSSEAAVEDVQPVFKYHGLLIVPGDELLIGMDGDEETVSGVLQEHGFEIVDAFAEGEYRARATQQTNVLDATSALMQRDDITYVEPDFVVMGEHLPRRVRGPVAAPDFGDPLTHGQYMLDITRTRDAHDVTSGHSDIAIAILDEGVQTTHPDLASALVASFDAVDSDTYQEPNMWDGHGTACGGLAGAVSGNSIGIKGTGTGCSLMAARIAYSTGPGSNWITRTSWIVSAIDWAWQAGADVLSNSWGGGSPSSAIREAFERARRLGRDGKGCVVLVAAGNESGPVSFPATLPNVLSVSASNEFDEFKTKTSSDGETWWGSNFGPEVDVAAPGVHNLTTDITGPAGYSQGDYEAAFNGTSSATPIVAGIAGLVLSANPELTEVQVQDIIRETADKVGSRPYVNGRNDQMGHGRANGLRAVQAASVVG